MIRSKSIWLSLAILTILAQLAVPAWMLYREEQTLSEGERVLIPCMPIDPYDAFRGRYLHVNPQLEPLDFCSSTSVSEIPMHDSFYVVFHRDESDRVESACVSSDGKTPFPALKLRAIHTLSADGSSHVQLPFRRYYLNEILAPEAEQAYRAASQERQAYLVLRIHNGHGSVENILVGNQPLVDFVKSLETSSIPASHSSDQTTRPEDF